jgi:hypothetical protein
VIARNLEFRLLEAMDGEDREFLDLPLHHPLPEGPGPHQARALAIVPVPGVATLWRQRAIGL